jgi:hypothetical protein
MEFTIRNLPSCETSYPSVLIEWGRPAQSLKDMSAERASRQRSRQVQEACQKHSVFGIVYRCNCYARIFMESSSVNEFEEQDRLLILPALILRVEHASCAELMPTLSAPPGPRGNNSLMHETGLG